MTDHAHDLVFSSDLKYFLMAVRKRPMMAFKPMQPVVKAHYENLILSKAKKRFHLLHYTSITPTRIFKSNILIAKE